MSRLSTRSPLPLLVRFCFVNAAIGVAVALLAVAAIVWFDVAGLGSAILNSPDWFIALFLLSGGMAVTFGGAAVASAVLMHAELEDTDRMGLPRWLRRR